MKIIALIAFALPLCAQTPPAPAVITPAVVSLAPGATQQFVTSQNMAGNAQITIVPAIGTIVTSTSAGARVVVTYNAPAFLAAPVPPIALTVTNRTTGASVSAAISLSDVPILSAAYKLDTPFPLGYSSLSVWAQVGAIPVATEQCTISIVGNTFTREYSATSSVSTLTPVALFQMPVKAGDSLAYPPNVTADCAGLILQAAAIAVP